MIMRPLSVALPSVLRNESCPDGYVTHRSSQSRCFESDYARMAIVVELQSLLPSLVEDLSTEYNFLVQFFVLLQDRGQRLVAILHLHSHKRGVEQNHSFEAGELEIGPQGHQAVTAYAAQFQAGSLADDFERRQRYTVEGGLAFHEEYPCSLIGRSMIELHPDRFIPE